MKKTRIFQINRANQIEIVDPTGWYIEDTWDAFCVYKDYKGCRTKTEFLKKLRERVLDSINGMISNEDNYVTRAVLGGENKEANLSALWMTMQRLNTD